MYKKIIVTFMVSYISCSSSVADSYEQWMKSHQDSYRFFKMSYNERYLNFKKDILFKWGSKTLLSGKHQYVIYEKELNSRTILDYENNQIIIESLGYDKPDVERSIKFITDNSIESALKNDPILGGENIKSSTKSLLGSITNIKTLQASINTSLQESDTAIVSENSDSNYNSDTNENDAIKKNISRVRIQLPNNGYIERARPFIQKASLVGNMYGIDSALILAITKTESSFNPLAQSPIPAFGLMQIVPNSAGRDVNKILYQKDKSPSASILFQPDDNLNYGGGYLHLLNSRYLKGIKNPQSKLYCVIAAYNTGAGNVASVFHPANKKIISPAIDVINSLSPDEVYERLHNNLPYQETRIYLEKVTNSMEEFKSINLGSSGFAM